MATEAILIERLSNGEVSLDYPEFATKSSDILSHWFRSLESRSSWFWFHYVNCGYIDDGHGEEDDDGGVTQDREVTSFQTYKLV